MSIDTRKKWLEELLEGVFGAKHVKIDSIFNNYEWIGDSVVFAKGWLQSVKCTDTYHANYIKLMKRALLDDDTVYSSDCNKIKKNFNKQHVIDNAKRYFKNYGFYAEKYSANYSLNDLGRLFYKIILTEFFPIIFEIGKDMAEDISDRYCRQTERIKHLFAAPDLEELFYINAQNKDIDTIIDYDINEYDIKADIAIPVNTSSLNLGLVISWKKNAVEIVTKPADDQFCAWSERDKLSLDELMEKWVKYPYNPDDMFTKPWNPWLDGFLEKSDLKQYCSITKTEIKYCYILSHYIYFLTNKELFRKCSSYSDMKKLIIGRLKESLVQGYEGEIYSYYGSIVDEIEEMLGIISSVNMELMIEHSKDNYKEIISHFNLEPDLVYNSCAFKRDNENDIIDAVYQLLEQAIYDFAMRIDDNCNELVKNLKKYLPGNRIARHMNKIGEYANDEAHNKYIYLLDEKLQEKKGKYYTPRNNNHNKTMISNLINFFSPEDNYLKCLQMVLKKYYNCLQDKNDSITTGGQIEAKNKGVLADPEFISSAKQEIDAKINGLRESLIVYLHSQYEMIMLITGKEAEQSCSDLEEYDKLRTALFTEKYARTLFYPFLLDMEKDLRALINEGTKFGTVHYSSVIDSNLERFKQKIYCDNHIDEYDY